MNINNIDGTIAGQIAYDNIARVHSDIQTLEKAKLLQKNITERPYLIAHYDHNDAGNRSYIKWQTDLAKILSIPYSALRSDRLADGEDVLQTIKNQNSINLIGALFLANPLHPDVDFQQAIDSIDPIKDIDGLSTFHKSKYMDQIIDNLEWIHFHPTALSVLSLLQETVGQDLINKKIIVAGWSGKIGSMICAVLKLVWAIPQVYNITPETYKPEELENMLMTSDGFVSVIRGAQVFDGALFDTFKWPIIDVTTAKNNKWQTVWWVQTTSFDPKADHIYIPPTKGGVGTITKAHLMANYIRAITQKMIQDDKDPKYFEHIHHKTNNSDIITWVTIEE